MSDDAEKELTPEPIMTKPGRYLKWMVAFLVISPFPMGKNCQFLDVQRVQVAGLEGRCSWPDSSLV